VRPEPLRRSELSRVPSREPSQSAGSTPELAKLKSCAEPR
jgi:hypothetical protein